MLLYYIILCLLCCYVMLRYAILYYIILYYIILYYIIIKRWDVTCTEHCKTFPLKLHTVFFFS